MRRNRLALALVVFTVIPLSAVQDDDRTIVVLPGDPIPAIDTPEFELVEKARRMMDDREIVIGLVA